MAVTETAARCSARLKLNGGKNKTTGSLVVKSCSLGRIRPKADAESLMRIGEALGGVLVYPPLSLERTEVTTIENA